jgi:hypothetical protein
VLRRIFGPKRQEVGENGEDCIMRSLITHMLHHVSLGWSNQWGEMDRVCGTHGRNEKCIRNIGGIT